MPRQLRMVMSKRPYSETVLQHVFSTQRLPHTEARVTTTLDIAGGRRDAEPNLGDWGRSKHGVAGFGK